MDYSKLGVLIRLAVIVILALAVYSNSLVGKLVWDDTNQIVRNDMIKSLAEVPSLFVRSIASEENEVAYSYRPAFFFSLALDYSLWGLNPAGYHATDAVLHALAAGLLFLVALRLTTGNMAAAFAGAMVFAVHPAHSEAVAWVSARGHLLAGMFMLLSFYLYISFNEKGKVRYMVLFAPL